MRPSSWCPHLSTAEKISDMIKTAFVPSFSTEELEGFPDGPSFQDIACNVNCSRIIPLVSRYPNGRSLVLQRSLHLGNPFIAVSPWDGETWQIIIKTICKTRQFACINCWASVWKRGIWVKLLEDGLINSIHFKQIQIKVPSDIYTMN